MMIAALAVAAAAAVTEAMAMELRAAVVLMSLHRSSCLQGCLQYCSYTSCHTLNREQVIAVTVLSQQDGLDNNS
jgi:hypothetical protein